MALRLGTRKRKEEPVKWRRHWSIGACALVGFTGWKGLREAPRKAAHILDPGWLILSK